MEDPNKIRKQLTIILGVIFLILIIPLLGEYIHSSGSIPKKLFEFPPIHPQEKAGFNLPVCIAFAITSVLGVVLYIYPWIFGFKRPPKEKTVKIKRFFEENVLLVILTPDWNV